MSDKNLANTANGVAEVKSGAGKVTFANEVIAIIAALAASETKGIAGMSGTAMSGITELIGRKNITKGVKVEVGTEEAAVDVYCVVKYGFRIQDVASDIQKSVKNAVENMTGLRVVEVNVYVQGIEMEKEVPVVKETVEIAAPPATPATPANQATPAAPAEQPAPSRVK